MTKFFIIVIAAIFSFLIAIIPEIIMYFLWGAINPQSEVARIMVLALFWIGGASFCVGFAALGFIIFMSVVTTLFGGRGITVTRRRY